MTPSKQLLVLYMMFAIGVVIWSAEEDIYENAMSRIGRIATRVQMLTTDAHSSLSAISVLEETVSKDGIYAEIGITYIRWGRLRCDGDSVAVYRGHMAGAHYNEGGGGSNYLCFHENPQRNMYFPGFAISPSRIYGTEYELYSANYVFSRNNSGGEYLTDFPAPCVACYAGNRTTVLSIPGRIDCPYGWFFEYRGYFVADVSTIATRHRMQYVCLDEAPEAAEGATAQHQAVVYAVEVGTGSLPDSVYTNGNELPCVVCTK